MVLFFRVIKIYSEFSTILIQKDFLIIKMIFIFHKGKIKKHISYGPVEKNQ